VVGVVQVRGGAVEDDPDSVDGTGEFLGLGGEAPAGSGDADNGLSTHDDPLRQLGQAGKL